MRNNKFQTLVKAQGEVRFGEVWFGEVRFSFTNKNMSNNKIQTLIKAQGEVQLQNEKSVW